MANQQQSAPHPCLATILYLLSILVLLPAAAASAEHLSEAEKAWLHKKGEIVFVSQSVYPPFEFLDGYSNREGMCIELVRWIATEFGFKSSFRDMPFLEAQKAVLSGDADVITSLFFSELVSQKFCKVQAAFRSCSAWGG